MASVYPRGNVLWLKYHFLGKLYRESLHLEDTADNRKLAEKQKQEKLMQLEDFRFRKKRGEFNTATLNLKGMVEEFIISKRGDTKNLTVYEIALDKLIAQVGEYRSIASITERELKDYRDNLLNEKTADGKSKRYAHNTVVTYLNHLRVFFAYAEDRKLISKNPVPKLKAQSKTIVIIPDKVMSKVLGYLKKHSINQYRFINFLYMTGFRRSEALNLKWQDIEFEHDRILVNNTKANRVESFPLYPNLKQFLKSFKNSQGNVFDYSKDGLKFWYRALDRLKLPRYSIHDLRRKFGTRQANNGITTYELMKLMRHSNIKTTMQFYVNVDMIKIGKKIV